MFGAHHPAIHHPHQNALGQKYFAKLTRQHGKGKALTVLAHKPARAVYHMLTRQQAFEMNRFLPA